MFRETWKFFTLTFAISWLLWLPSVLRSNGVDLPEIVGLFGIFSALGPVIAAFILVAFGDGWTGVKKLAKRGISLDFNKWWLIPTLLLFPIIMVFTIGIMSMTGGLSELPEWTAPSVLGVLSTFFIILFIGGGLEEFGWRGYALDRLQQNSNALTASLVLGFMWGIWHLPLHFIDTSIQFHIPVLEFVLQTMVLAVLYTWLYNNTKGSLLVMILFHAIGNTSSALAPPYFAISSGRWINFLILLIVATFVMIRWGWKTLRRDVIDVDSTSGS